MSDDPAIDEIRKIRREISQEFENDIRKLCEHLMEYQKQFSDRLVTSPADVAKARRSKDDEAA